MTSSMVDLAPPTKRTSFGSLRHPASDMNLRSTAALPHALGGNGLRPGTPSRPAGAKAEWVNPLAVHFCKDPSSSRPGTSSGPNYAATPALHPPASPQNFLGQFDLGQSAGGEENQTNETNDKVETHKSEEPFTGQNGYPSPPQSEKDSESAFSPISPPHPPKTESNRPSSSRRNAPSALRNVDLNAVGSLPSPAPSVQRVSEDKPDGPIIRNVPARRDTLAFHQPLRRSFGMEFEGPNRSTSIPQPKEGFSGNFADFDFGEIVAKVPSTESQRENTSLQAVDQNPSAEEGREVANSIAESYESTTTNQEGSRRSSVPTRASEDQVGNSFLIDQLPRPPQDSVWRPTGPPPAAAGARLAYGAVSHISPTQGFQSRFDSRTTTRAAPPRPLRPMEPLASAGHTGFGPQSPFGPPPDDTQSYTRDIRPPPRPSTSTSNAPSSPFSRPMQGDFPSTRGLPRGRRPEQPQISTDKEAPIALPDWLSLDPSEPRRSAIPAPLSPLRSNTSPYSPAAWSSISTPTSATAPRIPSPTFPSLAKSISNSSDTFSKSFEIDFDAPMGSPTLGGFPSIDRQPSTSAGLSSRRVEAKRAPPRPAPVTLPPVAVREGGVIPTSPAAGGRSPMGMEIPASFI